jgi:transposase
VDDVPFERHGILAHEALCGRVGPRCIKPMLPNTPRGVLRVNDRRVLNGIFWVLRSGAPWRDLPSNFGPYTTCYNRFVRWRRAGVRARLMNALADAHDAAVQMIDTSIIRVHQHGACISRNRRQSMGRSRRRDRICPWHVLLSLALAGLTSITQSGAGAFA